MTFTMCRGLPASGKSTWAATQVDARTVEVNMDTIRVRFGVSVGEGFDREDEKRVRVQRDREIRAALAAGLSVISSDCNISPGYEAHLRGLAEEFGARFVVRVFDPPVAECVRRDALRDSPVGAQVIRDWDQRWRR